jgi:hypothetical protein
MNRYRLSQFKCGLYRSYRVELKIISSAAGSFLLLSFRSGDENVKELKGAQKLSTCTN